MLRNKSYNFIQPNYMFISKLHNTQSKLTLREAFNLPEDASEVELKLAMGIFEHKRTRETFGLPKDASELQVGEAKKSFKEKQKKNIWTS
jgi:hypothetical protein